MTDPNQNPPADQNQQGGGQSQGGPSAQSATDVGGDVRQMRVDDLINIANQQNLDVSALENLIAQVNASPNVNVAGAAGGQAQPNQ
jgi:hypothetical protein